MLGVLGLSYASNQNLMPQGFEIGAGSSTKQQMAELERNMQALQQNASGDASQLQAKLAAVNSRLQQAEASLSAGGETSQSIGGKVEALETTLKELENAAKTGKGGRLAGLAAVTRQLKRSNKLTARLNTEFIKMREEQSSFRDDLANVRSKQADFNTSTAKLQDRIARLQNDMAKLSAVASRPPDVSGQIAPVTSELGDLKSKVNGLMSREEGARKEGRNIALALALGELRRAVNQGVPFRSELERVKPHAPQSLHLGVLEDNADKGLITMRALGKQFDNLSRTALAAETTAGSGSLIDQLMANARAVVQVRPTGLVEGDGAGAVLSRMEYRLQQNDLAGCLKESKALKGEALNIMQPWLKKAKSRLGGDIILRALEDKIRTSLAGAAIR